MQADALSNPPVNVRSNLLCSFKRCPLGSARGKWWELRIRLPSWRASKIASGRLKDISDALKIGRIERYDLTVVGTG
jgi:hypothetical protein